MKYSSSSFSVCKPLDPNYMISKKSDCAERVPRLLRGPMLPGNCAILHGGVVTVLILGGNGVICIARVERKSKGCAGTRGNPMVKVGVKDRVKSIVCFSSLLLCPLLHSLSVFDVILCLFCPSCLVGSFQCSLFILLLFGGVAVPKKKKKQKKEKSLSCMYDPKDTYCTRQCQRRFEANSQTNNKKK